MQVYLTCVLCKLTFIRYDVLIHFYHTACSSLPFMFDICLIYEYLRFKSSYFNPAKKIENALTNSAIYYLVTVVCELPMFTKFCRL